MTYDEVDYQAVYEYPDDPPPAMPDYLRPLSPSEQPVGTLDYLPRTRMWVIRGSNELLGVCKRLFPGCEGRSKQAVRIPASRRSAGELNWLMMRYPLQVLCAERWQRVLEEARQWHTQRALQQTQPLLAQTREADFNGELMEFQKQGVGYLLRMGRGLLADEMGLGKTVQALAYLSLKATWPVLVVVPPHLCSNWEKETRQFLRMPDGRPPRVHILRGLTPYALPEADVYIVHYLLLRGWRRTLKAVGFPIVIFDEIQELRHRGTEKYAAAASLADSADQVIGLSGTPIYNRGGEIWNIINILDYYALGDAETFARQWCDPATNTLTDPEALGKYLRAEGLVLRRTKEQVLHQLPPKRRLVQEIDSDRNVYNALLSTLRLKLDQLQVAGGGERALLLEQVSQAERQATGLAKAPHVCAFVAALLAGGERVLLFAHHHRVMDVYARELRAYAPVFITGREDSRRKDKAVEAFMSGKTRLCVVSLRAASGLNLQQATCVVFGELDWSPAVHTQAEDRAHRIGQQDSILCYYLVCAQGSDRDMQELLGLKVSQFTQLMGDRVPSQAEVEQAQLAASRRVLALIETLNALPEQ